jgi:hypothetical protein
MLRQVVELGRFDVAGRTYGEVDRVEPGLRGCLADHDPAVVRLRCGVRLAFLCERRSSPEAQGDTRGSHRGKEFTALHHCTMTCPTIHGWSKQ